MSEPDDRHRFRFFVDAIGELGARVQLDEFDSRHARVLHGAKTDAAIEIVDAARVAWQASFEGADGLVVLDERIGEVPLEARIDLFAFVSVGGRTDQLVDGAVQAGATRIVPVVANARDLEKVNARADRLGRLAITAAKQAKRSAVPIVAEPIDACELHDADPGIIVVPDAPILLSELVASEPAGSAMRLLIGASNGFPSGLVEDLERRGWRHARLGPTILRSELAAAVAVAVVSMHARPGT